MAWFTTNFLKLIFISIDVYFNNHKSYFKAKGLEISRDEIFKAIWQRLIKLKWINFFISSFFNPFGKNDLELLFYYFYKYFKNKYKDFTPIIKLSRESSECLERIIYSETLTIIVATHNGFAFATKLISDKKKVTVLHGGRSGKTIRNTFTLSGIQKEIPTIKADKYCFSKMLENSNEMQAYVCCIDERSKKTRIFNEINTNIFTFAIKYDIPIFFYQDSINEKGEIIAEFSKALHTSTAKDCSIEFLSFLLNGRNYKIKQDNN